MLCRPAFALVFLVSSTYAASTYNLPLLQETLEIIGGDLISSVTNMINGGEFKDDVEDDVEESKPLFRKDDGKTDASNEDQRENKVPEDEGDESSGAKDADLNHVETNTKAPDSEELNDGKGGEEDVEENGSNEGENDDEADQTDEEPESSVTSEFTNEKEEPERENEGSDRKDVTEDDNTEDEEEEDEAKVLAATVVNLAAEKIKKKLADFEVIN